MARGSDVLRRAALIAAGALALHELRYRAGYGGDAAAVAAEHGHAYLSWAAGAVVALSVAAGCAFVLALVSEFRRLYGPARPAPRFVRSWLSSSAALAGIYTLQELAEGWLAHGHPVGLAGVVGHAGWTAFVLALVVGALVALLLRGASVALTAAARSRRASLPRRATSAPGPAIAPVVTRPKASLLALKLAGRAPPALR